MVDPGLLGDLPLGHLLRLELSSEPFIEGSTGLVDHRVVPGAPFGFPAPLRDTTTIGSRARRPYHPFVPRMPGAPPARQVWSSAVGSGLVWSAVPGPSGRNRDSSAAALARDRVGDRPEGDDRQGRERPLDDRDRGG